MHPSDHASARVRRRGVEAGPPDCIGCRQDGAPDDGQGDLVCLIEIARDFLRLLRDLPERVFAVERLASSEEPDFEPLVRRCNGQQLSQRWPYTFWYRS